MRALVRQLRPAVHRHRGVHPDLWDAYPLLGTAIGQVAFGAKADGSLISRNGVVVGSAVDRPIVLRAAVFPLAAVRGRGGLSHVSASSGSNLGPTNPDS